MEKKLQEIFLITSTNKNKKMILYRHESQDTLWVHLLPSTSQKIIVTFQPKLISAEFQGKISIHSQTIQLLLQKSILTESFSHILVLSQLPLCNLSFPLFLLHFFFLFKIIAKTMTFFCYSYLLRCGSACPLELQLCFISSSFPIISNSAFVFSLHHILPR